MKKFKVIVLKVDGRDEQPEDFKNRKSAVNWIRSRLYLSKIGFVVVHPDGHEENFSV